jgi:hypothetical protein
MASASSGAIRNAIEKPQVHLEVQFPRLNPPLIKSDEHLQRHKTKKSEWRMEECAIIMDFIARFSGIVLCREA